MHTGLTWKPTLRMAAAAKRGLRLREQFGRGGTHVGVARAHQLAERRPVTETVADTWRWLQDVGGTAPERPNRTAKGLDPEVEAKVLASNGEGVPGTTP